MSRIMYSAFRSSVAVSSARSISCLSFPAAVAGWSYLGTSFHDSQSEPLLFGARQQQIPVVIGLSSGRRWKTVQHYCTEYKQSMPGEQVESTTSTRNCGTESGSAVYKYEQMVQTSWDESDIGPGTISGVIDVEESVDRRSLIELEIDLQRHEGKLVPREISPQQWEELLQKESLNSRKKYLKYLFLTEKSKENQIKKKEIKRIEREKKVSEHLQGDHIIYGLWCNTIFLRIHEATMNHFSNGRLMSAMMYGEPIVFDMGYDMHMNPKEQKFTAKQILESFAGNRSHSDPFYIHLCNASKESETMKKLIKFIPPLYENQFPMTVHSESYLDVFPKEKLVYLTPHSREDMTHFDHDAIYIIGAIVDLGNFEPLSLAKAKRDGIRMLKFPLERYLHWGIGNKALTLNQCLNILLDIKNTGDWHYSLRHVPNRKLKTFSEKEVQQYLRKKTFKKNNIKKDYIKKKDRW